MLQVQVTLAEAVDRHIILGLKLKAQPDNEDLKNEHASLGNSINYFRSTHKLHRGLLVEVLHREQELARINENLWRLEDVTRGLFKDVAGGLDILIANNFREIAKLNERRSLMKRELNSFYGEPGSEMKIYKEAAACTPESGTATSST